jgi:hypothetical protein
MEEKKDFLKEWADFIGDPFDLGSFTWGMVAGGIVVVTVEGVVLYFAWPYIASFLFGTQVAKVMK